MRNLPIACSAVAYVSLLLAGCSGSIPSVNSETGGESGQGGSTSAEGGLPPIGGDTGSGGQATGGDQSTGGQSATGGDSSTGGDTSSGGTSESGGTSSTGGTIATGGTSAVGGTSANGGTSATGGTIATGGTTATGGMTTTGGTTATGGTTTTGGTTATGGTTTTGGATATGGKTATGGTIATGGTTATTAACDCSTIGPNAPNSAHCVNGSCACYDTNATICSGQCIQVHNSDPNNCGSCGHVCPATTPDCNQGSCVCYSGNCGAGGASSTGGTTATGGRTATGGTSATGGATATGGRTATGGTTATGGSVATGGTTSTGSRTCTFPSGWAPGSPTYTYYSLNQTSACGYNASNNNVTNIANGTLFAAIPGNTSNDFNTNNRCGACIKINNTIITIVDECPNDSNTPCRNNPTGHLDLSQAATNAAGVQGDPDLKNQAPWSFVPCPVTGNVKVRLKPGNNNEFFIENVILPIQSVTCGSQTGTRLFYGAWHFTNNVNGTSCSATDIGSSTITFTVGNTQGQDVDTGKQFQRCN
jgi:hypothetical protein